MFTEFAGNMSTVPCSKVARSLTSGMARSILQKVRGPARAAASATGGTAQELMSWVQSSGGSADGVVVERLAGGESGGFGLATARACAEGSTLITLPQCCHLTYDGASDPRLLALIERVPQELWGAKLALQVLAQRASGGASPYAPYVAALPVGVQGLPMFFPGEALAALQYPPVTEQVKRRCRWLLSFSTEELAQLPGSPADPFGGASVDANSLGWALGVVTSRAFRTRGPGQPASMLPLVDMANHSFEPNARVAPAGAGGAMGLVATRDLAPGEPVHICYGELSNDFLLLDYGFVCEGNPHDTVQLRFDRGLVEAAKAVVGVRSAGYGGGGDTEGLPTLPAWQAKALASLALTGEGASTEVSIRWAPEGAGTPVDPRLLAGIRVLCAANAAELAGRGGVAALGRWDASPLAPAGEAAALRTLTGLCAVALSQFQGTLEDDASLLQRHQAAAAAQRAEQQQQQQGGSSGGRLPPEMELAVRFRMEKKRLLLSAINRLSARLKEVSGGVVAPAGAAGTPAPGSGGSSTGTTPSSDAGSTRGFATAAGRRQKAGQRTGGKSRSGKGFGS